MPFIGTQPEVGGYSVLDALTASATASYTLQKDSTNFTPSSANQLLVSLNGVIQKPGSSFTVSGSTLTFSSALSSSDSIDFILAMGEPLLVGTPSDGTVNADKLATNAVSSAKIASSAVTDAKIAGMAATKLTGTVSNARFPAGTVIQTVFGVNSTSQQLANDVTTFATTTTASITPISTSSKIHVVAHCSADVNNGHYRAIYFRILRSVGGSDQLVREAQYLMYDSNAQSHNIATQPIQALDAPGTTSAITYSIQGRHQTGSSVSGTYNGFLSRYTQSTLTLMEIAQ
jgi:hypothetical protein